ncbi:MBG domain-containing protein [Leeuwenhoekiella polynyae]|uniref:MBG domain-containing protein n=2 Tax=Leeuwenhoekiella polynyae TaxID=1550906 RepID=UPI0036437914
MKHQYFTKILLALSLCLLGKMSYGQTFEQIKPPPPAPQFVSNFPALNQGSIAFADVDKDGDQYALVMGFSRDDYETPVAILYRNDGAGNYTEVLDTPFEGVTRGAIAFADVDGDGYQDVLITGQGPYVPGSGESKVAALYRNKGNGTFTKDTNPPFEGLSESSIAFADVDGDEDLDVLIYGRDNDRNTSTKLYRNDGNGNFEEMPTNLEVLGYSQFVSFADADNDGDLDVLISGEDNDGNIIPKLYRNDGKGNFEEMSTNFESMGYGVSAAFADVTGNKAADVLITGIDENYDPIAKLYLNNGGAFKEDTNTSYEGVYRGAIAFADVTGNKVPDVLITGYSENNKKITKLYLNKDNDTGSFGTFEEDTTAPFEGVDQGSIAFADVDGDGSPDVLITGEDGSYQRSAKLYTNNGSGTFTANTTAPFKGVLNSSIAFADVDGNGTPDVLITGSISQTEYSALLFRNTTQVSTSPEVLSFSPQPEATDVSLQPELSVVFDKPVAFNASGTLSLVGADGIVQSYDLSDEEDRKKFSISEDQLTVSLKIDENLPVNTALSVGISAGFVKDSDDNTVEELEASDKVWTFTTRGKFSQSISFSEISEKTYGDAVFTLGDAKTDEDLVITYTAADATIVSISGNKATILKAGTTKITASQEGDATRFAATSVEQSLTVNKAEITITADAKSKVYGATDPDLTYEITSGSLETDDEFSGSLSRATGETVGDYAISSTLANSNYNITFVPADFTITEKAITITADAKSKVYGATDPALTYEIISGSLETGDELSGSLSRATGETVGEYAISSTLANANYNITFVPADLTITEKAITITAAAKSKVYSAADPALTYTVSPSLVGSDALTGSLSRATGETVGEYAISSTLANGNYDITFVPADFTITEKAITVTADAKSKVYGATDPALTYQISSGSLETDDELSGSLSRATGETVGEYAISSTLANTNYDITFVPADLTITEKAITITANATSKVYGSADPALTYQISSGSLETDDALTGSLSRATGETVGEYAIASTLANVNYDITFVSADLTITEKAITITADSKSKVYGATDPTLTYEITSGSLETDDELSGSLSRATGETVGEYAIASTLANSNYDITFVPADLTITEKAITITADAKSKIYGATDPALTYTVSPSLVGSDALTGSLLRATGETVGDYAISSTLANGNYDITFVPADFTITEKAITITADAKSKVYGAADPALTYEITSGSLETDDELSGSLSRATGETVGDYAIASTLANRNYDITFVTANLTITEKAITITADAKSKVYGATDPTLTYEITSGSLETDDELSGSLSRATGETVGEYAISSTLANANYNITFVPADLTITEKAITITADAKSKVYGATDPTLTYTVSPDLVGSDVLTGSLSRATGETVGEYAISSTLVNANYNITFVPADLTITEKAITITADAKSKVYGSADPALTYTVSPDLVGSDVLTGSLSRATGEKVGEYAISSTLANANYNITFVPADLTITEKAITITADAKSKVYGATDPALTYQISSGSLETGDALIGSLSRATGETVGEYAIASTLANANYDITFVPADFTITEKAITVTADAKSKVYGAADPALTYEITTGSLETDDDLSGSLSRTAGEDVGEYAISSTLANANYDITFVPADFTITEKAITVTADSKTKVYGEVDPALTYKVSPALESGDALTGGLSRATGETVDEYAISSTLANSNYDITFVPADLTITEKAITVTADAKTKVYGEVDPALTYKVSPALESGDALTGGLSRSTGETVGEYAIASTLANTNYDITFVSADLTITEKAITVTADAKTKVYAATDPDLTYSVSPSLETGDALIGSLLRATGETVGEYAISSTLANTNYDITFVSADLTITEKAITITADSKSKVYGAADPALTYKVSPALEPSDALTGSLSRATGETVGEYAISSTLANANYNITFVSTDLTITEKAITINADATSKVYGSADPALTYQISSGSLETDDELSGSLSRATGETVGEYAISSSLANSNYDITFVPADFTIKKAAAIITADATQTFTYNGSEHKVSASLNHDETELVYTPQQGYTAAGTYTVMVKASATTNYLAASKEVSLQINNAEITGVSFTNDVVTYDGKAHGVYVKNLSEGATVTYDNNEQTEAGTYTVTATISQENFRDKVFTAELVIEKAPQQITFDELPVKHLEQDSDFELDASTSSGLPVSYTYTYTQEEPAAVVSENGIVSLLNSGVLEITATQNGNANYLEATPITRTLKVNSNDSSVNKVVINGNVYDNPATEIYYRIACDESSSAVSIEIYSEYNASVNSGLDFVVNTPSPGVYKKDIQVTSQDGTSSTTYHLNVEKPFDFNAIVEQKFNNTLLVNNNPETNGGYEFAAYEWYIDGRLVGTDQYYSAGDAATDTLDPNSMYEVVITTTDGDVIHTCASRIQLKKAGKLYVAPNPVFAGSSVNILADFEPELLKGVIYSVYNQQGVLIQSLKCHGAKTPLIIDQGTPSGVYMLIGSGNLREQSVKFIVR